MNTNQETTDGPALMAAAAAEAARVVTGAAKGAAKDAAQDAANTQTTPCTDWDLRTLLNHTILWTAYSAERRAHGESVAEELMSKDFTAEPDYAQATTRPRSPGPCTPGPIPKPGGASWASWAARPPPPTWPPCSSEMVLHGWDVAKATGQDYRCDDAVAAKRPENCRSPGRPVPPVPGVRRRRPGPR
jgi:hypothetical protein